MKKLPVILLFLGFTLGLSAQEMTPEEYKMVSEFRIENLDEDTYIKMSQEYVLDRYNMKPPYYIAGEKDTKNRVDLYTFIKRDGMVELGLLMVYTHTSTGEVTHLCLPYKATKEVWSQYYDDLKYGGQDNPSMAFAIGSVLSKELSSLAVNGSGEDYTVESSDYDICFPAESQITLSDGRLIPISKVKAGDEVLSSLSSKILPTSVQKVEIHEGNYVMNKLVVSPSVWKTASTNFVLPERHVILGTPNHPVFTTRGVKCIKDITTEDEIVGYSDGEIISFTVHEVSSDKPVNKVYNLVTESGNYFVNGVLVSDKR